MSQQNRYSYTRQRQLNTGRSYNTSQYRGSYSGNHYTHSHTYTQGNAARNLEVVPLPDYVRPERPQIQDPVNEEERSRRSRLKREKAMARNLDVVSVLFLTLASVITVYMLVSFLTVRTDVTQMSRNVVTLQNEIRDLKTDNSAELTKINANIDLSHIYKVATEELGMVHASRNRVIAYESTKSDFVKQYGEIPETESENILDTVIGGIKNWSSHE
ncbi:hypothetical protein [Anaerolentibacter hominis]|uniref:hypothetical protein n=1 Tax=Anaerolentibacter hominis TaxID=3079009 RepID=UPI0031B84F8C